MRNLLVAGLVILTTVSCGTAGNSASAKRVKPEIQIAQLSGVPLAARREQGALSVQFAVSVGNRSAENITLKRVNVQSMGEGAYHVSHSSSFNVAIAPDQFQQVQFWVPAHTGVSLMGVTGPVMMRVTAEFDSPSGKFQEVVTRVVSDSGVAGE